MQKSILFLQENLKKVKEDHTSALQTSKYWKSESKHATQSVAKSHALRGKLHRTAHELDVTDDLSRKRLLQLEDYEREIGKSNRRIEVRRTF